MKTKLFIVMSFFLLFIVSNLYSQADYSDPKDVAAKFLQLFIEGKRFLACEQFGATDCQDQISILLQKMVMNNMPLKNKSCKYKIDSCSVAASGNSAKCFYSKVCKNEKNNKKGFLTLIKIDNKWLVEYLYKRDKYL